MSDTDQVLESVAAAEPNEPVITEAPEEVSATEEVAETTNPVADEPQYAPAPAPVEEVTLVEAEPDPVEEIAPVEEVTTQEVVQNVQEILSSTETNVTVDNSELENRVKVLEERLEKLIDILSPTGLFINM